MRTPLSPPPPLFQWLDRSLKASKIRFDCVNCEDTQKDCVLLNPLGLTGSGSLKESHLSPTESTNLIKSGFCMLPVVLLKRFSLSLSSSSPFSDLPLHLPKMVTTSSTFFSLFSFFEANDQRKAVSIRLSASAKSRALTLKQNILPTPPPPPPCCFN